MLAPFKYECNGEPVAGLLLSAAVGMGLLCIGSLDAIAPILTMFFLVCMAGGDR